MKTFASRMIVVVLLGTAGLVLAVPGCAAAKTVEVGMTDSLQFTPKTVTIHRGDTVVWKNTSQLAHTVTDVPTREQGGRCDAPQGRQAFQLGLPQSRQELFAYLYRARHLPLLLHSA